MRQKLRPQLKKRLIALLVAAAVVMNTMLGTAWIRAEELPPKITATLYSGDAMPNEAPETDSAMLFTTYLSQARNPEDEITLAMNAQAPFVVGDDAVQLGTAEYPFTGTIHFNAISEASFITEKALFAYLSTDAQFMMSGTPMTGAISIARIPGENAETQDAKKNSALFAEHVVAGAAPAAWNITAASDGENNATYAGVIGELGEGAAVDLTLTNDASSGGVSSMIWSQGNVGLVCGTMLADSELTLTLGGSFTTYTVTSDSGAAGGLVGAMLAGSKLILASSYSDVVTVTANANAYVPPAGGRSLMSAKRGAAAAEDETTDAAIEAPEETTDAAIETTGAAIEAPEETSGAAVDAPAETTGAAVVAPAATSGAAVDVPAATTGGAVDDPETPAATSPSALAAPVLRIVKEPVRRPATGAEETTGAAIETTDAAIETTDAAIEATGAAIETPEETTDAAIETTGAAVETPEETTGAAIETTGAAVETPAEPEETTGAAIETPEETTDAAIEDPEETTDAAIEENEKGAKAKKAAKAPSRSLSAGVESAVNAALLKPGHAGGIVGWAEDAEIVLSTGAAVTVTVSGTVAGMQTGGGVFGYYHSTEDRSFELDFYTVTAALGSGSFTSAHVGGFFGFLDSAADTVISDVSDLPDASTRDSFNFAPSFVHGANGGGLIGYYLADSLARELILEDLKAHVTGKGSVSMTGGLIGRIGERPAYVRFRNVGARGTVNGGLLGSAGNGGSFIDVREYAGLQGTASGGIVQYLNQGVLRLQGITHMHDTARFSGGMTMNSDSGQIVYERGSGLVYAAGTGSDATVDNSAHTGWKFYRVNGTRRDDIFDWGEVLRFGDTIHLNDGIITEDLGGHTVTVGAAVTSMGTVADFAKTALQVQHNVSGVAASGALRFAAGSADSATLLGSGSTLTLTADISLQGTGLTGLTRDNGTNAAFAGTLDGGGHTVTLATGEVYGLSYNGGSLTESSESSETRGAGRIYNHRYSGLIAIAGGATIRDLTVDGRISVFATNRSQSWYIGGIAAQSSGDLTLTDCSVGETIRFFLGGDRPSAHAGGAVGNVADAAATVAISGGTYAAEILDLRTGANGNCYFGGVIGYVSSADASGSSQQIDFDISGVTLAGSYTNAGASNKQRARYGGLIAYIRPNSSNTVKRSVSLQDVTVGALDVNVSTNYSSGGMLGYEWLTTDVTIGTQGGGDGLVIDGASIVLTASPASSNTMMGGLMYGATGHWVIHHLEVADASMTTSTPSADFGFVAGNGVVAGPHSQPSALYLEIPCDIPADFDLSGLDVGGSTFRTFDEIVTYTVPVSNAESNGSVVVSPKPITDNGAAIVSLNTLDGAAVSMDGTSCNTYQNQTAYGQADPGLHRGSRYYYALSAIAAKGNAKSDGEKLLFWSLSKYAHSTIRSYFPDPLSNTLTGSFDMEGISYYPVTASNVTVSGATVKFYNEEIESGEQLAGGDGLARSTRAATQHELMHSGIFYDAADLTVSGLTLQGTAGREADGSGFLVRGTLTDTSGHVTSITNVTLDGAMIRKGDSTPSGAVTGGDYAPLLINKAGSNSIENPTNLIVTGVQTTSAYPAAAAAASSLLGNVGGSNVQLLFSDMRLDARTASAGAADSALTAAYGTTKSIFTRATLLNEFSYSDASSSGQYNFNKTEDWNGSAPLHHVTYGYEISGSLEYADIDQDQYFDEAFLTNPESGTAGSSYDFSDGRWLRYVYTTYDDATHKHELKINQKLSSVTSGCGKWDDPYIITDGAQLASIANIIRGDSVDASFALVLPDSLTPNTQHTASGSGSKANDEEYSFDGANFTSGGNSYSLAAVREYLAGAFYKIGDGQVVIPDGFSGLGSVNADFANGVCAYAFRGVLDGDGNTIINNSAVPLIVNSNGAVIKNLTLVTTKAYTASQNNLSDNKNLTFKYYGGMPSYGALIGQVMGGDTFIDNVTVAFNFGGDTISVGGTAARLIPVGGYIGVLVNGGVIFRNMPSGAGSGFAAVCPDVNDEGWLYQNPIIGRVIMGYAFSEGANPVANGDKNYDIPVLDPGEQSKLTVTKSQSKIDVPNGQALWVLGAIVNSGAAGASGSGSGYPTIDDSNQIWSGYRSYTAARTGNAAAAPVTQTGVTGYHDSVYNTATKTPYIIAAYASSNDARTAGNIGSAKVEFTGDCTVPSGFRGLGNIYKDNNNLRITPTSVDGGTHTVTLDLRYQEYVDSSATQFENYRAAANCSGLGLFNIIGNSTSPATFKDLALAGTVYYDVKDASGASNYDWNGYESGSADGKGTGLGNVMTALGAGGLVGYFFNRNFVIQNVRLDGIDVQGARYAGGLVGLVITTAVNYYGTIIQCGTGTSGPAITVKGGFAAGGLIGRVFTVKKGQKFTFTVTGKSDTVEDTMSVVADGKSLVKLDEIVSMGQKGAFDTYQNFAFAAGGLFGFVQAGNGATFNFTDYEVRGGSVTSLYKYSNNRQDNGRSGGVFGALIHSNIVASGIKVKHVDVRGNYAGGFAGKSQTGWTGETRSFADLVVDGTPEDSGANATILGDMSSGGLFGLFEVHENPPTSTLQLNACTVNDCTIGSAKRSMTDRSATSVYAGANAAGGLIGDLYFAKANATLNITDAAVKNCTIYYSSLTKDVSNTTKTRGAGGFIGVLYTEAPGASRALTGHNIQLDSNSIEEQRFASESAESYTSSAARCGTLFGWNGDIHVMLAGISACGSLLTADSTTTVVGHSVAGDYGSHGGYAAFADYNGTATVDLTRNTAESMLYNSTNDLAAAEPYVTVNPALAIDGAGSLLTGDGMAASVADSVIYALMNSAGGSYQYAWNKTGISKDLASRMSTFNTEMSIAGSAYDLAALVVDASDTSTITQIVNSYLDHLTNMQLDFNDPAAISGICDLRIRRMALSAGVFGVTDADVSMSWDQGNRRFSVARNFVDNNRDSFTLIDVAFYDPSEPSKIAYHLYAPVIVKKVLEFDFTSYVLPGTTYRRADYVGHTQALENFGTPVTLRFDYTYHRSASEWEGAMHIGDDLTGNYAKSVLLTKYANVDALPAGTRLALVDAQNGRAYYRTLDAGFSGELLLSSFTAEDGVTPFTPVSLSDMLSVAATTDAEGAFVQCAANDPNAVVRAGGSTYRLFTEGDEGQRYALACSTGSISETYYLSIFTDPEDSGIARYTVDCPKRLPDPYPTLCTAATRADFILGQVYTITSTLTTSGGNHEHVFEVGSSVLTADMTASVTLNDGAIYKDYIGSMYHSFLLHLTRTDHEGSQTAIIGAPTASGTYSLDGGSPQAYYNDALSSWEAGGGFAQFTTSQDISASLKDPAKSYTATISASVTLDYHGNESAMSAQFPERPADLAEDLHTGTTAFLKSAIASTAAQTAYSKTQRRVSDSSANRYFSNSALEEAILHYHSRSGELGNGGDFGELGINALDNDDATTALIETVGVLDFRAARRGSEGYTHLKLVLSLGEKRDSYASNLTFSEYLTDLKVAGATVDMNTNSLVLYIPKDRAGYAGLSFSSDGLEATIPIDLTVKTGTALEAAGKRYSNYRIMLDVDLVEYAAGEYVTLVNADPAFVIYTNAKILPDYIDD